MRRNKSQFIISAITFTIIAVIGAKAGGPLYMWNNDQRIPYRWDVSTPVKVYTDIEKFEQLPPNPPAGATEISIATANAAVAFSIGQWSNVETSSFQAEIADDFASIGLPNINSAANAGLVIGPDNGGGVHVIYDETGRIMRDFMGAPSGVLGIASPEWADESTGTITESYLIVNPQLRWVGDQNLEHFRGVFTHEFGHAINLAHSQVNGEIFRANDGRGPGSCTTLPYNGSTVGRQHLETMFPFLNVQPANGSGRHMSTVDITDDIVSVSNLYPAAGYPSTRGSIRGRLLTPDGKKGLTGANIIVRNVDNPFADAVSAMSGDYVRVATGDDGSFTINGLTPGARYVMYNDTINAGGYPTSKPFFIPEGEEFYNGANESGNGLTDDRCQSEPITAVAGATTTADIELNAVKGAPKFTPMVPNINPHSVTADGGIIAGSIPSGGGTFRWTEEDGYLALNTTPNAFFSKMSRDGGWYISETLSSTNRRVASLLNYPGGPWVQLPVPVPAPPMTATPSDYITAAWGVADNGKAVAGSVAVDLNGPASGGGGRTRPFIWTPEGGSQMLPVPSSLRDARPNDISADGSTVLGWYDAQVTGSARFGARWVNGEFIPFSTTEMTVGEANESTPDGQIIIGRDAGPRREAWFWTQEGGIRLLGRVGALNTSSANAISDDGQVIAGFGGSVSPFVGDVSGHRPFLWTPELGFVNFQDFLAAQGTTFDGWLALNSVNQMTPDGNLFVGVGYSPIGLAGWKIPMDKVNVCHAPPGNPRNAHTINVPFRGSMAEHLRHGDTVGVCSDS